VDIYAIVRDGWKALDAKIIPPVNYRVYDDYLLDPEPVLKK
jgi:hypothetical protein